MKKTIATIILLYATTIFCCADTLSLPDGVTVIEEEAFYGDDNLESVVIPNSVKEIGKRAFADCENLGEINLPGNLIQIGDDAFLGSPNVVAEVVEGSIAEEYCEENDIEYNSRLDANGQSGSSEAEYYNGHRYKIYNMSMTPQEQQAYCQSVGGYLLTITSQSEQDFIEDMISRNGYSNVSIGIGGSDAGSEGNWYWMNGEDMTYTNWASGEPNNGLGRGQSYMQIYGENGKWDDYYGGWDNYTDIKDAFICEWETNYLQWSDGTTVAKKTSVSYEKSEELLTINTNGEWFAAAPTWISVSPSTANSKEEDGQWTIEANIQKNTGKDKRTGTITIYVDGCDFLVMEVMQDANVPLTIKSVTWNLGWEKVGKGQQVRVSASQTKNVTYNSSDTSVATISSTGLVKALGIGDTTITVTNDKGESASHVMHVYAWPFKWEDIKEAVKRSNKTLAQLMDLYYDKLEMDADAEIAKLEENINSIISVDPNLGAAAEKVFRERMNEIIQGFKYDVSSYEKVETGVDLARKVLNDLYDDTVGGFTFTCNGKTYTCTYEVTANVWGTVLSLNPGGIVASNGKTYSWMLVAQNSKSIESEMIYLKQFADMKIQEVRDKAYSDAVNTLGISEFIDQAKEFFKSVKSLPKSKAWSMIQNEFPDLAKVVEDAKAIESKFNNVKSTYEGLKAPDWTGDLGTKVVSDIMGYHEKVNTFIEAVEAIVP